MSKETYFSTGKTKKMPFPFQLSKYIGMFQIKKIFQTDITELNLR